MILRWLYGDKVVDGSTLEPGKSLYLHADRADEILSTFRIFQTHSPAIAQVRRLLGATERSHIVTFPAEEVNAGLYRSDHPWELATPRGLHFSNQFIFTAEPTGDESGRVRSNKLGEVKFGGNTELDLDDPTGITAVPAHVNGGFKLAFKFKPTSDPDVSVRLLTGEELVDFVLSDVVGQLKKEEFYIDAGSREYDDAREILLALYTPPTDWTYALDVDEFEVATETEAEITLTLEPPSSGRGAFVLYMFDKARWNYPDERIVSDVLAVRMDQGQLFVSPSPEIFDTD